MELKSGSYFKFKTIGDVFQGRFVSFERDVEGNFGPRDQLTLKTRSGAQTVDCSKFLSNILRANEADLEGKIVTVTYIEDRPTKMGNHMKTFHVDAAKSLEEVQPPPKARPAPTRAPIDPMENDAAEPDPF